MAALPATEDYYAILEVDRTASPELIRDSYKRRALIVHPDRTTGSKEEFETLVRAYETLGQADKRREYDSITSRSRCNTSTPSKKRKSRSPRARHGRERDIRDATLMANVQKAELQCSIQWRIISHECKSSILEIQSQQRQLEQEIGDMKTLVAAEAATEAQRIRDGGQADESVEEAARNDEARQGREMELVRLEREYALQAERIQEQEGILARARQEFMAEDQRCQREKQALRDAALAQKNRGGRNKKRRF